MNMYQDQILDHYKNPRNYGTIEGADKHAHVDNPLCGDEMNIYLKISNGVIEEVKFSGEGCAISRASASLFTGSLKGKTIDEVRATKKEQVIDPLGIPISPSRMKCALLVLDALDKALKE